MRIGGESAVKVPMSWRVAVVVLSSLLLVSAFGTIPYSAAQMNGPTPAEAQQLIAQAKANLDAAIARYQTMHTHMMTMDTMSMNANEKQMLQTMEEMNATIKLLIDSNQQLLQVVQQLQTGAHNK